MEEGKTYPLRGPAANSRSDDFSLSGLDFVGLGLPGCPEKAPLATRLKNALVSIAKFSSNQVLLTLVTSCVIGFSLSVSFLLALGLTIGSSIPLGIILGGLVSIALSSALLDLLVIDLLVNLAKDNQK